MKRTLFLLIGLVLVSGCQKHRLFSSIHGSDDNNLEIMVTGQSNAVSPSNSAETYYSTSDRVQHKYRDPMTEVWVGPKLITESEPISTHVAWLKLGDKLSGIYGGSIVFRNYGFGNTTSVKFKNDHEGILSAILQELKHNPIDVILWVQGESDVFENIAEEDSYQSMKYIFTRMHEEAPHAVIYCAKNSSSRTRNGSGGPIRRAQERIIQEGYARRGPDVDELRRNAANLLGGTDEEFVGPGLEAHAQVWFDVLKRERPWGWSRD